MNDINSQYDENFATVRAQYDSEDPAICAGGAMNDINSQYDENFATVRAQYESEDPAICAGMAEDAYKSKIKDKGEGSMSGLLVVLGLICFGMLFIMFLTLEAFYIYKGGDDDDDDDDDGEE